MNEKIFIGIDLGGTKIMTGAVRYNGDIIGTPVKIHTGGDDTAEVIIKKIIGTVEKVISDLKITNNDVAGIGIGSTGPLDIDNGLILECPQLPTLHFFPLSETIHKHFGIAVYLNNDANCLVLAECNFGAAKGKTNIAGFTLGTGIGCGVILNKKIFNGATGTAAEIWTSPYRDGMIEDFISGNGVERMYDTETGSKKSSLEIFNLAEQGDEVALKVWEEFGLHLAVPLAWTINLLDPEIVILGGSITAAYPYFKASMEINLKKWLCPVPAAKTKVVPGSLGGNAGFIGAACLAMENI